MSEELLALFFIDSEDEEFEVVSIKLEFEIDGERKSINVQDEMNHEDVTVVDVLNWHGSDHSIDELAKVLADVVNGKYDAALCKQEILNLR